MAPRSAAIRFNFLRFAGVLRPLQRRRGIAVETASSQSCFT